MTASQAIATRDDERDKFETFRESQDNNAREYLTRVLTATGGERQRAAKIADINRTHLQKLIGRYKIPIAMNPKARGRRKSTTESSDSSTDEISETKTENGKIRF